MTNRLAIDIGGTFTDIVLDMSGTLRAHKLLTTHDDPSEAVFDGIVQLLSTCAVSYHEIDLVVHGTTLATNAIIERRGAKVALLTTAGHRDVLEMAFENRFEQYDVNIERPQTLIPRYLRIPISERMGTGGVVLRPLDEASVAAAIEVLEQESVESVAVGFLHSYANASHEERVRELLLESLPNLCVSLSADVCPEIREYERFSTTAANAYVLPKMSSYLQTLEDRLVALGIRCPYFMMTSGGGLTTLNTAARYPIRLVESGPAGGALLAAYKAKQLNESQVLSFDMGGTTAKICLIDDATPQVSRAFEVDRRYRFKKGSGLPVRIPVIEMVEIGAGGGSIATVDSVGRIAVGPQSAGSVPGPACYGLQGQQPTVTDADLILGRLDPQNFAGGEIELSTEYARQAVARQFEEDESACESYASAIAEVVDENMSLAARGHAMEWGKAIENRLMVAYGGAAPLHAARLLEKLELAAVVIPKDAGVGSAVGFLLAPISYEVVRSEYGKLADFNADHAQKLLEQLRSEAVGVVAEATAEELTSSATVLMRYVGQGYEISVPVPLENLSKATLLASFESKYEELYHRLIPGNDVEIISWTMKVSTQAEQVELLNSVAAKPAKFPSNEHIALTFDDQTTKAQIIPRRWLRPGDLILGPALIVEDHTTTVVPKRFQVAVNTAEDLILKLEKP